MKYLPKWGNFIVNDTTMKQIDEVSRRLESTLLFKYLVLFFRLKCVFTAFIPQGAVYRVFQLRANIWKQ